MYNTGRSPREIVDKAGIAQISDTDAVQAAVDSAVSENPQPVADYLGGKENALRFLVGQVMKATRGKARSPDGVRNGARQARIDAVMRASGYTNGAGASTQSWLDVLRKFMFVGLGVKRWLLLGAAGIVLLSLGFAFLFKNILALTTPNVLPWLWGGCRGRGARCGRHPGGGLRAVPYPAPGPVRLREASTVWPTRCTPAGPAAAAPGSSPSAAGTGLSVLLRGLKTHSDNISAVVTVADDGGSSGRLRRELGVLPPGDFRNCLVAMAGDEFAGRQAVPAPGSTRETASRATASATCSSPR